MGLFKRKPPPEATPPPPPPPEVKPGDEDVARRVVKAQLAAVGDDGRMRATAFALSQAGGGPADSMAAYDNRLRTGDSGLDRPWRWLAAVAERSRQAGDAELVAEIALLVYFWDTRLRGRIGVGDSLDMMLECPPDDVATEVYSIAVMALRDCDPNRHVVRNPTGDVTVLGLSTMIAGLLLDRGDRVAPEVREAARRTRGGTG